jgi:hypothetical protein
MKPNRAAAITIEIIAALFILLFLYTALTKLEHRTRFVLAMRESPLIGNFANPLSWLVPMAEFSIVLCLIFPATRFAGLLMSTLLIFIFSGYIAYMLISKSHLPCNCGGVLEKMSWRQHLIFNIVFLLLGIVGIQLSRKTIYHDNRSSRIPV